VPFPRKLLNDGEDIILDLHPHWWALAKPIAAVVAAVVLGAVVLTQTDNSPLSVAAGILVLLGLGWFGVEYGRWVTTNFVITTDRLIYRHGLLAKHGIEIPLERVNTVFFSQSLFERMLRSGDLVIESAGEQGRQAFSNVRKPSAIQNEIYKQMEANENRKYDRIGRNASGGGQGLSVTEQLERLNALRESGALSDEEYQASKARLLEKM
jgi:uncharacterized membrane protein YdbT with pleckstrin-like domain